MSDRVVANRDRLLGQLEVPDRSDAQRRFEEMANGVKLAYDQLGGERTARFCLRVRGARMAQAGLLTETEWSTLRSILEDDDAPIVAQMAAIIVLIQVGASHGDQA